MKRIKAILVFLLFFSLGHSLISQNNGIQLEHTKREKTRFIKENTRIKVFYKRRQKI